MGMFFPFPGRFPSSLDEIPGFRRPMEVLPPVSRRPRALPKDATTPPKTMDDYIKWLSIKRKFKPDLHGTEYRGMSNMLREEFRNSAVWKDISAGLSSLDSEYSKSTSYRLFADLSPPELLIKPWESLVDKMFRWEIVDQGDRFDPKLCDPDLWYERANDIVRTLFEVKYLDGVESLLSLIKQACLNSQAPYKVEYKSHNDGYYAVHAYTKMEIVYTPYKTGGQRRSLVAIEFQITTQLQEVLRALMHPAYTSKRASRTLSEVPWEWRYTEDEFFLNYLGHMLHSIEGMIMKVRRGGGLGANV